jgi:MoaA/NifB/PqqE/SkfB family radical SAM enzyme
MSPLTPPLPRRLRRLRRYVGLVGPVLASNLGRLDAPWKLTYAITYVCNHRCEHCNIWTRRPKGELDLARITALFAANPQLRWLDLTGGEPTARADLPDVVRAAARHLPSLLVLHFPTNGSRPERALAAAEAARDAGPAKVIVTVSLDGPPAVHDALRGTPGAWDAAVETFARLRAARGIEVVFGLTITDRNAERLRDTYTAARSALGDALRPSDLHLNVAQRSAHFYGNSTMELPDPEAVQRAIARFPIAPTSARSLMERGYQGLLPRFLASGASPVRCQALSASVFVDPWGTAYPCITEDRPLGGLEVHGWSLAALWRATAEAADDMAAGRCAGCWTPCEAYPSLLGSLPRAGLSALRGATHPA